MYRASVYLLYISPGKILGGTAPILIVNEESPSNNGLEIPGLKELVPLHSAGADSELGAAWHKAHKAKGKGKGKGKGTGVGVG